MSCYREGGCGPYESRPCNECPASKPSYLKRKGEIKMNENNGKLNEFIQAVGAMAEMSGLLRDNLIKSGFTREEACKIVATVISSALGK